MKADGVPRSSRFSFRAPRGNNGDRRQWRKQGAAVGAALRFFQAAIAAQEKTDKRKRKGPQAPGGTSKTPLWVLLQQALPLAELAEIPYDVWVR